MVGWFSDLGLGMMNAMDIYVFLAAFIGVIIGVCIGVIPGLGPAVAMSLAIPLSFNFSPTSAISLMLGIYKGGTYGGSISAILINTPGTPAAAATILDGYPLAKQGKSGKALQMALYASVFGDAISIFILMAAAQPLAAIALKFGPTEVFSLLFFALTVIGGLSGKSLLKGFFSACVGLMLCMVGIDTLCGETRFTFGFLYLEDGLSIIPMVIGLFAVSEVFRQLNEVGEQKANALLPPPSCPEDARVTFAEFKRCLPIFFRSSIIGASIGALPGTGSTTAAYLSYGSAQRHSKTPELFGKGNIEGVAAAESGNNAVCGGALIPMFSLGIPGDVVTAILMGALLIHGIVVGPTVFVDHRIFMFTIFSMLLISILMLLAVGLISIRCFRRIAELPSSYIMPVVMVLCVIGTFATNLKLGDMWLMLLLGVIGLIMVRLEIPLAPMVIAFVLTPKMEQSMRQALIIADGQFTCFVTSPISLFFLCLAAFTIWRLIRKRMAKA